MAELAAQSGSRVKPYAWLKPGVFIGCLVPLALMLSEAARGQLGADPIAIALNRLGLLALITLVGSLAATPLRLVLGWSAAKDETPMLPGQAAALAAALARLLDMAASEEADFSRLRDLLPGTDYFLKPNPSRNPAQ